MPPLSQRDAPDETVLSEIHRLLVEHPDASIEPIARLLRTSVRSLQRQLHSAGTSFRSAVLSMRVRRAQALMIDTELSLSRIALEVGFSSPARFAVAFRRLEGVSPSAWRSSRKSQHALCAARKHDRRI